MSKTELNHSQSKFPLMRFATLSSVLSGALLLAGCGRQAAKSTAVPQPMQATQLQTFLIEQQTYNHMTHHYAENIKEAIDDAREKGVYTHAKQVAIHKVMESFCEPKPGEYRCSEENMLPMINEKAGIRLHLADTITVQLQNYVKNADGLVITSLKDDSIENEESLVIQENYAEASGDLRMKVNDILEGRSVKASLAHKTF